MDVAQVRTAEGQLSLFVAINRTSKFALARLHDKATRPAACQFPEELLIVVPYRIHTRLTDRAIRAPPVQAQWRGAHPVWPKQPRNRNTVISRKSRFDMICEANGIEHRLDPAQPSLE